ncbi:hypothetical protein L873DRAFT_1491076 [Choiromyces venosus 120613-1]|uniref:Uncharacterized protein n=1 Tax=Choiromyces venosus 120613-1 TaxID=1336337 RepID=A0A3N4J6W0_9PEZI|nr:hypothetical protein L873DRAFT_1491076 [Choiromyces venosus 120613-1]
MHYPPSSTAKYIAQLKHVLKTLDDITIVCKVGLLLVVIVSTALAAAIVVEEMVHPVALTSKKSKSDHYYISKAILISCSHTLIRFRRISM